METALTKLMMGACPQHFFLFSTSFKKKSYSEKIWQDILEQKFCKCVREHQVSPSHVNKFHFNIFTTRMNYSKMLFTIYHRVNRCVHRWKSGWRDSTQTGYLRMCVWFCRRIRVVRIMKWKDPHSNCKQSHFHVQSKSSKPKSTLNKRQNAH